MKVIETIRKEGKQMTWEADVLPLNYSRFSHFRATIGPQSQKLGSARSASRPAIRQKQSSTRGILYAVLFLVLTVGAPAFGQVANTQTLPLAEHDGLLFVTVQVDDTPRQFLLDTGAKQSILSRKIVMRSQMSVLEHPQVSGLGGSGSSVSVAQVTLAFGGIRVARSYGVTELPAFLKNFDGILGQDILRQFASYRIDNKTHTIEVVP